MAIRSFRHKGLEALFEDDDASGLDGALVKKLRRMLAVLDQARTPAETGPLPGWRLHPLKGDLKGYWSLTVSGNWRLIFRFEDGNALAVDLVDYH